MRGELGDLTFEAWVRREWESADAEAKAQLKRMKKLNLLDDLGRKEYKDIKKKRCGHCECEETPVMKFSVCSSCRKVAYCNEICQRSAWPDHKAYCRQVRRARESGSSSTPARDVASVLWRRTPT